MIAVPLQPELVSLSEIWTLGSKVVDETELMVYIHYAPAPKEVALVNDPFNAGIVLEECAP